MRKVLDSIGWLAGWVIITALRPVFWFIAGWDDWSDVSYD